jgi:hypothetical protein
VKALLPQLQASLPQGIDVKVLADRTETVRASVQDVERTLVITVGLVVAVIFLFLRNVRSPLLRCAWREWFPGKTARHCDEEDWVIGMIHEKRNTKTQAPP